MKKIFEKCIVLYSLFCFILMSSIIPASAANAPSGSALGQPASGPGAVNVLKRAPVNFVPFLVQDPANRQPIPGNRILILPNGKQVSANVYYAKLNELEKKFNALGYSLRDPASKVLIQRSVPKATFQQQQGELINSHSQSAPVKVGQIPLTSHLLGKRTINLFSKQEQGLKTKSQRVPRYKVAKQPAKILSFNDARQKGLVKQPQSKHINGIEAKPINSQSINTATSKQALIGTRTAPSKQSSKGTDRNKQSQLTQRTQDKIKKYSSGSTGRVGQIQSGDIIENASNTNPDIPRNKFIKAPGSQSSVPNSGVVNSASSGPASNRFSGQPIAPGNVGAKLPQTTATWHVDKKQSWTKSLGDKDIFATEIKAQIGVVGNNKTTRFFGKARADGWLFNRKKNLLEMTGTIIAANVGLPNQASLKLTVGDKVILNPVVNAAGRISNTLSKNASLDMHVLLPFYVGPIQVNVKLGTKGEAGVRFDFVADNMKASAEFGPYISSKVYAQIDTNIVIAGVGAESNLVLIDDSLELAGEIGLAGSLLDTQVYYWFSGYNEITALKGKLNLFAYVYVPAYGVPPWDKKTYDYEVASWNGFHAKGYIFKQDTVTVSVGRKSSVEQPVGAAL